MTFPPVDNMREEYPVLAQFDELKDLGDEALKYLSYFCDPNSVIDQRILDIREKDCREKSGYTGTVEGSVMTRAMTRMLYLCDDLRFEAWISLRMAYQNLMARTRKPVDETEISEDGKQVHMDEDKIVRAYSIIAICAEKSKPMREEIIELEHYLFPDHKTRKDILTNIGSRNVEDFI